MKRYMEHMVRSTDKRVKEFLNNQVKDSNRNDYGGIQGEIFEVKPTVYAMAGAVAVYVNPMSQYYKSQVLYEAMERATIFIRRCQREDGSFDYPSCNFKSAPDTSFCFKRLIAAYRIMVQYDDVADTNILQERYKIIMKDALKAICEGGFHTPNHRWGITAALLQGANLFKDDAELCNQLTKRAWQYLNEGIDGNADGEYAERSTGNYNAVVNNAMMAMYEETNDEMFLGYVERNLHMMLTYIDSDDTIFTQNSTRQDQGKAEFADKYFYQYLYMAAQGNNPEFDGAAHKIIKDNLERGALAPDCLHILMLHDEMMKHTFTQYGFLESYRNYFEESGVLRVKNKKYGYTVLNGKSAFLFFKVENTQVYLKIGESYCDIRNFVPQEMVVDETGCTLRAVACGWYYQPFEEKPDTSDWWQMDHKKRKILTNSEVCMEVRIEELESGIELNVNAEGLDGLPLRLEFCIPAGASVANEHFYLKADAGNNMILRRGVVEIGHEGNQLLLGPGFGEHEFQGHYSGEEYNQNGYTIYCNGYTPYKRSISLMIKE